MRTTVILAALALAGCTSHVRPWSPVEPDRAAQILGQPCPAGLRPVLERRPLEGGGQYERWACEDSEGLLQGPSVELWAPEGARLAGSYVDGERDGAWEGEDAEGTPIRVGYAGGEFEGLCQRAEAVYNYQRGLLHGSFEVELEVDCLEPFEVAAAPSEASTSDEAPEAGDPGAEADGVVEGRGAESSEESASADVDEAEGEGEAPAAEGGSAPVAASCPARLDVSGGFAQGRLHGTLRVRRGSAQIVARFEDGAVTRCAGCERAPTEGVEVDDVRSPRRLYLVATEDGALRGFVTDRTGRVMLPEGAPVAAAVFGPDMKLLDGPDVREGPRCP